MARRLSGSVKRTDTVLVTSVDVASADITGVLPVANGGTGSGSFTDGQLLIGTTSGNTLTKATLTAGSGISVTNGSGSITIAATGGGGLTNWSESAGTYSSKDWKRFYPVSGTNVNVVFSPLGTGSIQAHVADGTSTGGNQRGTNAVDWQTNRASASQVASGVYSSIPGGRNNTASGACSMAAGFASVISGAYSFGCGASINVSGNMSAAVGANHTVSATYSFASGLSNIVDASYSVACGYWASSRATKGVFAFASGKFSGSVGNAQLRFVPLRGLTTDATPKILTTNAGAASTTNQVALPNNSAYTFRAKVTAHRTDVVSGWTHRASWIVEGAAARDANAASTIVTAVINTITNAPAWTLAVTADTTNGGIAFTFTGAASQTIRTVAVVQTCEVTS